MVGTRSRASVALRVHGGVDAQRRIARERALPSARPDAQERIPTLRLFKFHSTCYRCLMSQYWLVKQEPTAYSWDQFVADGKTDWTGVRNFQARNNLRSMKLGDSVLYYHSVNGKAVVGIAKVTKEAFRDPTAAEGDWSAVELMPVRPVDPPVKLDQIKKDARLANVPLLRNLRLSVMKLTKEEFDTILELGS